MLYFKAFSKRLKIFLNAKEPISKLATKTTPIRTRKQLKTKNLQISHIILNCPVVLYYFAVDFAAQRHSFETNNGSHQAKSSLNFELDLRCQIKRDSDQSI